MKLMRFVFWVLSIYNAIVALLFFSLAARHSLLLIVFGCGSVLTTYVLAEILHSMYFKPEPPKVGSMAFDREIKSRYK